MWQRFQTKFFALSDTEQTSLLSKFLTLIQVQKNIPKKIGKLYKIKYRRYQIVHVNFVGMGTVLDGPHYAIVWE